MTVMIQIVVVHFCTFTFIQRLLKSDFSQVPPTGMHAQTRQFLTIASRTVPVRCPRSSDCQVDCSTLWGRKHGSFWVQNGQLQLLTCLSLNECFKQVILL